MTRLIIPCHSYDALLQARSLDLTKHLQCPDRCVASRIDPSNGRTSRWQPHDPERDGRIFICRYCEQQPCVTCDRPEHFGQTCTEAQLSTISADDAATNALLATLPTCPFCNEPYEYGGGCAYFQCGACKYRFCGECWAPWTGPRGEYEMGALAHREHCKFRVETPHRDHTYRPTENKDDEDVSGDERTGRGAKRKAAAAVEGNRTIRAHK